MRIEYTSQLKRKLIQTYKRRPQLRKKVVKQVKIFEKSPIHPSLRMHKLAGKRTTQYSIWIEGNLRITFIRKGDTVILLDLITHDEY